MFIAAHLAETETGRPGAVAGDRPRDARPLVLHPSRPMPYNSATIERYWVFLKNGNNDSGALRALCHTRRSLGGRGYYAHSDENSILLGNYERSKG